MQTENFSQSNGSSFLLLQMGANIESFQKSGALVKVRYHRIDIRTGCEVNKPDSSIVEVIQNNDYTLSARILLNTSHTRETELTSEEKRQLRSSAKRYWRKVTMFR